MNSPIDELVVKNILTVLSRMPRLLTKKAKFITAFTFYVRFLCRSFDEKFTIWSGTPFCVGVHIDFYVL